VFRRHLSIRYRITKTDPLSFKNLILSAYFLWIVARYDKSHAVPANCHRVSSQTWITGGSSALKNITSPPSVSRLSRQCGILNISQPYRFPRPVTRIALLLLLMPFSGLESENTAVGIRHADHAAPCIRKKFALTSPTSSGCSVGIVRSRTQATELWAINAILNR
jgi:hypothetical protein